MQYRAPMKRSPVTSPPAFSCLPKGRYQQCPEVKSTDRKADSEERENFRKNPSSSTLQNTSANPTRGKPYRKNLRVKPSQDKTSTMNNHLKTNNTTTVRSQTQRENPKGKPRAAHKTDAIRRLRRPHSKDAKARQAAIATRSRYPSTQRTSFTDPAEQIIGGATIQLSLQDEARPL